MNEMTQINDDDSLLIDLVMSYKMDYIQNFLRSKQIPVSGTKEELRRRLRNNLISQDIDREELIELLDIIEKFGNQHIYLLNFPETELNKIKDNPNYIRDIIEENDLLQVYNNYNPLMLPRKPEISSIEHDENNLIIRWVSKKIKYRKIDEYTEEDSDSRNFLIKKYLIERTRAATLFRLEFTTGNAELLIHQLPMSSNYYDEMNLFLTKLNNIFSWGRLGHFQMNSSISDIETSGEVRTRDIALRTSRGSHIDFASPSSSQGIYDDPEVEQARSDISTGQGNKGNFYWLSAPSRGVLSKEIHTIIYRDRVAFTSQCLQQEVDYVMGRIRHFLR